MLARTTKSFSGCFLEALRSKTIPQYLIFPAYQHLSYEKVFKPSHWSREVRPQFYRDQLDLKKKGMYHAVYFPVKIFSDWSKLFKHFMALREAARAEVVVAGKSADTFRKLFNTCKNFRNIYTEQLVQWCCISSVSTSSTAFGKYPTYLYLFSRPIFVLLRFIEALNIKGL